jgi:VanZ family protein
MFPPIEPDLPPEPPRPRIIILPAPPPPRRSRLRRYLPVLLWMVVIYVGSTELGRPENSEAIINPVLQFFGVKNIDRVHILVRKLGHVAEYFVLALLLAYFCLSSSRLTLRRWWIAFALLGVLIFAASDEYHQTFEKDRVGSVHDVALDTVSGAVALSLVAGWRKLRGPTRF